MYMDVVERDLNEYFADECKRAALADFVESEIVRCKDEAIRRFSVVTHPQFAEQIAVTTAFGYKECLPEATKIIDYLLLEEKHIASILEDSEWMEEIVEKEKASDLEDWLYASINY